MIASQAEKVLVPHFMIPSIKEEDFRAVKKASIRVLRKIPCAFNELLFTDLQLISNTVKRYLFNYIMPINRILNFTLQHSYMDNLTRNSVKEAPCYLCNLPIALNGKQENATNFYAKLVHMKCVDRSIKHSNRALLDTSDVVDGQ